jgi:hypothetical protein
VTGNRSYQELPTPNADYAWTQEAVEHFVEYLCAQFAMGRRLTFDAVKREVVYRLPDEQLIINGVRASSITVSFPVAPLVTIAPIDRSGAQS